jgi:hypothetical protein
MDEDFCIECGGPLIRGYCTECGMDTLWARQTPPNFKNPPYPLDTANLDKYRRLIDAVCSISKEIRMLRHLIERNFALAISSKTVTKGRKIELVLMAVILSIAERKKAILGNTYNVIVDDLLQWSRSRHIKIIDETDEKIQNTIILLEHARVRYKSVHPVPKRSIPARMESLTLRHIKLSLYKSAGEL